MTDARSGGPGWRREDRGTDTTASVDASARVGQDRFDPSTLERLVDELTETCLQLEAADNVRDTLLRHNLYAPDSVVADISSAVVAMVADRLTQHLSGRLGTRSGSHPADRAGVAARAVALVEQIDPELRVLAQTHGLPVSFVLSVAQRRAAGEYAYAPPATLQEIDRLLQVNGGATGSVRIEVFETPMSGDLKALGAPTPQTDQPEQPPGSTSKTWSVPNGPLSDVDHAVNGHASTNGHASVNGRVNGSAPDLDDLQSETVAYEVEQPVPVQTPSPDESSCVRVTAIICADEIAQAVCEAPNRGRALPEHLPLPVEHLAVPDGLRCVVEVDLLPGQIVTIEIMEAADRRAYDHQVNAWASDSASRAAVSEQLPTSPPSRSISYLLTADRQLVHADGSRRTRELLDEYLYGGIVELGDLAREVRRRSARRGSPRCHQAEIVA